jgi:hypothetical protein
MSSSTPTPPLSRREMDAFNPLSGWYDTDVIGIDLGIMMLMAENRRTGFVWNTFMKNAEAVAAMTAVGFH